VSPTGIRGPGGEENSTRALDARPVAGDLTALDGDQAAFPTASVPLDRFKLARLHDLGELESGVYWPRLQPYFIRPYFRRLTYRLIGSAPQGHTHGEILSTRGASGVGELDIAYIADRCAAELIITEAGLPDYCLTIVSRGALTCFGTSTPGRFEAARDVGLIYRGLPGTTLAATHDHERLAIWVPVASLQQRLAGLLGGPLREDIVFDPMVDLSAAPGQRIRRLVRLLVEELGHVHSFAGNDLACRSFTDLLLYSMLQALPNNYSERLARLTWSTVPGTVRRAEEYIRAHAAQPIALHDIAAAAGCSVRSLQLGFKQFRATTPAAAILQARLEAVRQGLSGGGVAGTVTDLAYQYGFTNPGRFTSLYKAAFGVSPMDALRRDPPCFRGRR
jgi:AraC-like DNA-binding protein